MPPLTLLPFEKPIADLQAKLEELRALSAKGEVDVDAEAGLMEKKIQAMRQKIYGDLSPWQKVQVARHPQRPYTRDYLEALVPDFTELHGDRLYGDDRAIQGGLGTLGGRRVLILGTQKGRDTRTNLECNFGCPRPEGYRKALRLMRLAARFGVPIVTLIDTPGAFPGLESEERHVAEAIAVNLREMFTFPVPIVVTVIGEGGSGGALGIGVGDRILILEHAYYSVISPEGCAAILWKDRAFADRASEALKLTAQDLHQAGLVDEILPEPLGGAHQDPPAMARRLGEAIGRHLDELSRLSGDELLAGRYEKFRAMGVYAEEAAPAETAPPEDADAPPAEPAD